MHGSQSRYLHSGQTRRGSQLSRRLDTELLLVVEAAASAAADVVVDLLWRLTELRQPHTLMCGRLLTHLRCVLGSAMLCRTDNNTEVEHNVSAINNKTSR